MVGAFQTFGMTASYLRAGFHKPQGLALRPPVLPCILPEVMYWQSIAFLSSIVLSQAGLPNAKSRAKILSVTNYLTRNGASGVVLPDVALVLLIQEQPHLLLYVPSYGKVSLTEAVSLEDTGGRRPSGIVIVQLITMRLRRKTYRKSPLTLYSIRRVRSPKQITCDSRLDMFSVTTMPGVRLYISN
jgi:hypothetical protein